MGNAANDKYNATKTVTKESTHAVSFHWKSNDICHMPKQEDGKQSKDKFIKSCKYCGKCHNTGQCPGMHVKCDKCSQVGHFANICRSSNNNPSQGQQAQKL